jgi:hypothetical protein
MRPNASDLPNDVRQNLVDQIRNQVGDSEYDRLVDQMGENQLIDYVLQKMDTNSSQVSASIRPTPQTPGNKAWEVIKYIIFVVGVVLFLLLAGQKPWDSIIGAIVLIYFLVVILKGVIGWIKSVFDSIPKNY